MPQIQAWSRLLAALRGHLVERMHDRNIGLEDLNRLRLWMESKPDVPEGPRFKDFGSFKLCGDGKHPKTFLLPGQAARAAFRSVAESQRPPEVPPLYPPQGPVLLCKRHKDNRLKDRSASG